jgi:hypothetical protein
MKQSGLLFDPHLWVGEFADQLGQLYVSDSCDLDPDNVGRCIAWVGK